MTSERKAPPRSASGHDDAFRAFFDVVDSPAALCDPALTVLTANAAFSALCGVSSAESRALTQLLPLGSPPFLEDGGSAVLSVELAHGGPVTLQLSRRAGTVAVVVKGGIAGSGNLLASTGRALLEQARIEQALLEAGRAVATAVDEAALIDAVADAVRKLFPERSFRVRIVDPRTGALTSERSQGTLKEGASQSIVLRRSSVLKTQLDLGRLAAKQVTVVDTALPLLFFGTVRGLCCPLAASGTLFGAIHLEYPPGLTADPEADDRVLVQLANQVAVGVRNAKLIEELSFVRKYHEELLEHANALILVAGRDRKIRVFNKALVELTGWSKEEVLGQDLLQLVPESEKMRALRIFGASLQGEQVTHFETRLVGKRASEVRVSFATSSVLTAGGEVEGVIAIGQDLTRMRELELRVIQAEKLASLGQLAASVAHEINNPMTAVVSYADALLARSVHQPHVNPDDLEKYRKIRESGERVLRFSHDLVSYARPSSDRPEAVNVHQVLDQAVEFCDHVLKKQGVRLERAYGALPPLPAVRSHLLQVFINLVTNACHAMSPGGTLTLTTAEDAGDAVICVQDTGSGIAPEHLAHIFEPFFTTKPDGRGTGLGLSIVQDLVERQGGVLTVDSQLGAGTTFRIRLPQVSE